MALGKDAAEYRCQHSVDPRTHLKLESLMQAFRKMRAETGYSEVDGPASAGVKQRHPVSNYVEREGCLKKLPFNLSP